MNIQLLVYEYVIFERAQEMGLTSITSRERVPDSWATE